MDQRSPNKRDGSKDPPVPEPPRYTHEQVLERLSVYEHAGVLNDAKDYYVQKYGMLLAPPVGALQSERATMVGSVRAGH